MLKLFRKNKSVPEEKPTKTRDRCTICSAVQTAGRGGEKIVKFINKEEIKVEIINESGVPERMCYTLNLQDDPNLGWASVPITYCPWCGNSLRRKDK